MKGYEQIKVPYSHELNLSLAGFKLRFILCDTHAQKRSLQHFYLFFIFKFSEK